MGLGEQANWQRTRQGRGRKGQLSNAKSNQESSRSAWAGFMGQWNTHVRFPTAVWDMGWVGMEGPSEWGRKREDGKFFPHQQNQH